MPSQSLPKLPRRIAAVGTFDGVHRGHQAVVGYLVAQGKARGLVPAVVTFSSHPLAVVRPERVPKSLCSVEQRTARLREAGVDDVILLTFDETLRQLTARDFIAMLHDRYGVDAIVLGFNNSFGSDRLKDFDDYVRAAAESDVEILPAPRYDHLGFGGDVSSTAIRHLIASGDVDSAARLLGHPVTLSGEVVGGKRLGRTIGFPTANLQVDSSCAVPAEGVYACRAFVGVDGSGCDVDAAQHPCVPAMVNIGRRPTVDTSADPLVTVEAHLIGFNGDLYGSVISLEFVQRIRDERRFDSLEALIAQLEADRAATEEIIGQCSPLA